MDVLDFEIEVVSRFLSDNNIPIKTVSQEVFVKQMNKLGYWDKWVAFVEMVNKDFSGDASKFLDYYYQKREEMIQALKNEHYEAFNNCDMDIFAYKPVTFNGAAKSVWNHTNAGGVFISIDLKKANFQALSYVNPAIVLNCKTWDEFCRKFTDCEYIIESKYIRQVVFGQLNPSRHTTVERNIMGTVYEDLARDGIIGGLIDRGILSLCAVSVDELVFRTDLNTADIFIKSGMHKRIEATILEQYGFYVKVSLFTSTEYHLRAHTKEGTSGKDVCTFFLRTDIESGGKKIMCVPQTYHGIVWQLMHGEKIEECDRHFVYEGLDCTLNENFVLADAEGNTITENLFK